MSPYWLASSVNASNGPPGERRQWRLPMRGNAAGPLRTLPAGASRSANPRGSSLFSDLTSEPRPTTSRRLLTRTASGKARVLNAYCPHLGANMAEGGVVMGEELECPFHLWRFCGESGKCTSIPYSAKVPVNARTKSWECVERNRVIFVWYHAEGAPPDWWPNAIPEIASNAWSYHGRNEFYINCHIQEIPENGADWAHLNSLHGPCVVAKDVFSRFVRHSWTEASWSTNFRDEPADDEKQKEAEEVVRSDEAAEDQADRHRAVSLLRHELLLLGRYRLMKLNVVADQIGPGYVELRLATTFGPLCIVQTVTPVEPLVQRVTHLIFSPQLLAPYAKLVMLGECLQFERDARIWNRKKYLDRPVLVRDECTINVYRRWYRQFYSENSPTYESCKDGLDW